MRIWQSGYAGTALFPVVLLPAEFWASMSLKRHFPEDLEGISEAGIICVFLSENHCRAAGAVIGGSCQVDSSSRSC
jgi:hypothetical protein